MALALTCETLPNTELLYPYPWKKQFQFSGEAQEASDGQMSEPNSLVADDPQITARLASGANSCVDVQGYPAAIPDRRESCKAARRRGCQTALASKTALRTPSSPRFQEGRAGTDGHYDTHGQETKALDGFIGFSIFRGTASEFDNPPAEHPPADPDYLDVAAGAHTPAVRAF